MNNSKISPIGNYDTFFTKVNHNLKTPLHIIKSVNEAILRESNEVLIKEYSATAMRACDMFELLINRLILISQFAGGKAKATSFPFSLIAIIDDFISSCSEECRKKNICFDFDISAAIPDTVVGDSVLVRQVIYTLITDLIEIIDIDRLVYSANFEYTEQDKGFLQLNVSAYATNIYNDIKTDINFPTEIYKCIIELLDGEGTITDEGNKVKFNIRLPLTTKNISDTSQMYATVEGNTNFIAPSARILIVDDYQVNISVLSMLLKHTQIQIDSANSGLAALEMLKKNTYDIIFIDYLMPEMNGLTLMSKIKKQYPDILSSTSIYILSANIYANDKQILKEHGFKGYLPKPLSVSTLNYIIKNNIPEKKLEYPEKIEKEEVSEEQLDEYRSILKQYDASLDDALHYMSDDFREYINVSEVTLKQIPKNTARLNKYFDEGNCEALRILVHSIKSNSKLLGFNTFSNLSAQLELKAAQGDIEYIQNCFSFFMYSRSKVAEGIEHIVTQVKHDGFLSEYPPTSDTIDKDNYLELLDDYIDNLEPEPSLRVIKYVIEHNIAPDKKDILNQISEYIEELEYESAATLLKEIM